MFYTKYRPQKFDELFGLESITRALTSQLKKNQVGHAYLFAGPRGTGKTTVARILAKEAGCRGLDLIEIDAASHTGVDDIRYLREKIGLAPAEGERKVYLIDEAHMLSRAAFNALLKTLEEPPEHAILILATTEPEKIPETVRSRCQRFDFGRASTNDIVQKLKFIAQKEKAKISSEDLELLAKSAEGGFRDAETMLEQVIVGGVAARDVVGLTGGETMGEFVDFLLKGEAAEALKFVNKLYDEGISLESFTATLLEYLRGVLLFSSGVGKELLEAPEEVANRMKSQASKITAQKLGKLIQEFTHASENISKSAIPQLPLELAIMQVLGTGLKARPNSGDLGISSSAAESKANKANKANKGSKNGKSFGKVADFTGVAEVTSSVSDIVKKWDNVLSKVKPYNHSLEALLRSCRPLKVEDNTLHLEAFYKFHKERLEQVKNRRILENVLNEITGAPLKVRTFLGRKEGKVSSGSSKNRSSITASDKSFDDLGEEAVEVFNGEL